MNLHLYPVVVVGSGPSLSDAQCQYISKRRADNACRVIVCNDTFRKIPNADILFAADGPWIKFHCADVLKSKLKVVSVDSRVRTLVNGTFIPQRSAKPNEYGKVLLPEVGSAGVNKCTQSGMMAVMYAVEQGATHIILVGMDAKRGSDNKSHFFGDHPRRLSAPQPFDVWQREWNSIAPQAKERGIRIVQCSLDHGTKDLERSTVERELSI